VRWSSHPRNGLTMDLVVERRVEVLQRVAEQQAQRLGRALQDAQDDAPTYRRNHRELAFSKPLWRWSASWSAAALTVAACAAFSSSVAGAARLTRLRSA
jgi:hypothetical protein